jgi:hypothetical protein
VQAALWLSVGVQQAGQQQAIARQAMKIKKKIRRVDFRDLEFDRLWKNVAMEMRSEAV